MTQQATLTPTPTIVVICAKAYQNNQLHGCRLPAIDKTAITQGIQTLLRTSPFQPATHWQLYHYEHFFDVMLHPK